MNRINRRTFIYHSAVALGAASSIWLPMSCTDRKKKGKTLFKYSFCNESLREYSWEDQCRIISETGYTGVEIAPFTLVGKGVEEINTAQRRQMVKDMKDNGLECVGLHWLLSPPPEGLHFTTPDAQLRRQSVNYLDALIDFCGDLDGEVMIFGSPGQRSTTDGITVEEAMDYFADGLASVADHAGARKVKILVEPLTGDQTDVVNTLGEAMKIVEKVDHPAVSTMFDFHNTADENHSMDELIRSYYDHLHHVHFQKMDGSLMTPSEISPEYLRVFEALKDLNYKKWISVEVFDFSPGGKTIAKECMKTLLEIERRIL